MFIYFLEEDILPESFSTPMFWSAEDLEALKGTTVIGAPPCCVVLSHHDNGPRTSFYPEKIGKEDAEEEYRSRIVPVIKVRMLLVICLSIKIFSMTGFQRLFYYYVQYRPDLTCSLRRH